MAHKLTEIPDRELASKGPDAKALGSKDGKKHAEIMTPERHAEIAKKRQQNARVFSKHSLRTSNLMLACNQQA
jgi:hypothetical protein